MFLGPLTGIHIIKCAVLVTTPEVYQENIQISPLTIRNMHIFDIVNLNFSLVTVCFSMLAFSQFMSVLKNICSCIY